MEEFYHVRLEHYGKRKRFMLSEIERDIAMLENKLRFIEEVNNDQIILSKRKKKDIVDQLVSRKFTPESKLPKISSTLQENLTAKIQQ